MNKTKRLLSYITSIFIQKVPSTTLVWTSSFPIGQDLHFPIIGGTGLFTSYVVLLSCLYHLHNSISTNHTNLSFPLPVHIANLYTEILYQKQLLHTASYLILNILLICLFCLHSSIKNPRLIFEFRGKF